MRLLSHGQGSDLLTHLKEVCTAATCLEERIILACHDMGKATIPWQAYINKKSKGSPHPHAAAGGILAACVLLSLPDPKPATYLGTTPGSVEEEKLSWALIALHTGAAHHSELKEIRTDQLDGLSLIAEDRQARDFYFGRQEGIASLLPEVPDSVLTKAWDQFRLLAPTASPHRDSWNRQFRSLPPDKNLRACLRARNLLGRFCLFDHLSASRQSGKPVSLPPLSRAWEEEPFLLRKKRHYPAPSAPLHHLRRNLRAAFEEEMEKDDIFYFIDAPTGLGKTEAMLSAAEKLLNRLHMNHVVFSVPQVSIADQIFEEYFQQEAIAQIWNYRRREATKTDSPMEAPQETASDAEATLREQHPFSKPYNVTTFNQVLLSMCHPDRRRCLRGAGLRDTVIIMDEFHKLPMSILPFFFRFAREFATQANCRFILGSATPLNPLPYWDIESSVRLPEEFSGSLYRHEAVNRRRTYRSLGALCRADLIIRLEQLHSSVRDNILVVVNLVEKGSWPLQKHFRTRWDPWDQLAELESGSDDRVIVCLDGLMPPVLRRQLVRSCKAAMKRRPVTLISTQMIEVGVDLDFDRALTDYQGIASIIQRGGRTGREGRDWPCEVEVFSLLVGDKEEKTSFEILLEVETQNQQRLALNSFRDIQRKVDSFHQKEQRFFREWQIDAPLLDSELAEKLSCLQKKCFGKADFGDSLKSFLSVQSLGGNLGAHWENAQFIAELFDDAHQAEIIVLPDWDTLQRLNELANKITCNKSSVEERKEYIQIVSDYKLTLSSRILPELNLGPPSARLAFPEEGVPVYQFKPSVL